MKTSSSSPTHQFMINLLIITAFLFAGWILFLLKNLVWIFFISCFLALLFGPFVLRLRKWKCPEVLAIFLTFFTVLTSLILFLILTIPLFVGLAENSKNFVRRSISAIEIEAQAGFPFLERIPMNDQLQKIINTEAIIGFITDQNRTQLVINKLVTDIDSIKNFIQEWSGQLTSFSLSFASILTSVFAQLSLIIIMTFLIILERKIVIHWFLAILPHNLGSYFRRRQTTISHAIHNWLRAQLIMVFGMFFLTLVGLLVARYLGLPVEHIFSLALIAGMMEFVPYLGPVIAFVPAFFMVLFSPEVSWITISGVIALYVILQQLEGTFLYTFVMSHTLRLPSVYILVFTLAGVTLGGPLGMILAIPFASIVHIFYHDWMHYRNTGSE